MQVQVNVGNREFCFVIIMVISLLIFYNFHTAVCWLVLVVVTRWRPLVLLQLSAPRRVTQRQWRGRETGGASMPGSKHQILYTCISLRNCWVIWILVDWTATVASLANSPLVWNLFFVATREQWRGMLVPGIYIPSSAPQQRYATYPSHLVSQLRLQTAFQLWLVLTSANIFHRSPDT